MIIGITGTIGAGKGTVAEYLVTRGFTHYSARSLLLEEIKQRGIPKTRDSMFIIANEFRAISPGYIVETLLARANKDGCNAVVESIRSPGEVAALRKYPDAVLLAVDAPARSRFERILLRKSSTDSVSYEKFLADEEKENQGKGPNETNLLGCIALADYLVLSDGDMQKLFQDVETILEKIKAKKT